MPPRRRGRLAPRLERLMGQAARSYYLSQGRLAPVCRPIFVRDREGGGWALSLRSGGREELRLPLPPDAAAAISQPGSKVGAILQEQGGRWHLLLGVGPTPGDAERALDRELAHALIAELGLGRALRLAARFRRYGPLAFAPAHPDDGGLPPFPAV